MAQTITLERSSLVIDSGFLRYHGATDDTGVGRLAPNTLLSAAAVVAAFAFC
jgi:hypothetical protein